MSRFAAAGRRLACIGATGLSIGCASAPVEAPDASAATVRPTEHSTATMPIALEADRARRVLREAMQRQMHDISRLLALGTPLAIAAAPLCRTKAVSTIGTLPATLLDAPETRRAGLRSEFGLESRPTVLFVIHQAPAWQARIAPGDVIDLIEAQPAGHGSEARERLRRALDAAVSRNASVPITVIREGRRIEHQVTPVRSCMRSVLPTDHPTRVLHWEDGTLWVSRRLVAALDTRDLSTVVAFALASRLTSDDDPEPVRRAAIDAMGPAIMQAAGLPTDRIGATWRRVAGLSNLRWESDWRLPLSSDRIARLESSHRPQARTNAGATSLRLAGESVKLPRLARPAPWMVQWRDEAFDERID